MATAAMQKFLFDRSFDDPAAPRRRDPRQPVYSETDWQRMRGEAEAEGRARGRAEAEAEAEARSAEALGGIARALTALVQGAEAQRAAVQAEALDAVRAMLERAMPALARRHGQEEIEAVVAHCLRPLLDEPRVVVRVADSRLDALGQRIGALAERAGYPGRIILLAEPGFGPSDCRVEWADGGAERRAEAMWADIDAAVGRILTALAAPTWTRADKVESGEDHD